MRNVLLTIAMLFGFSIANAEEFCTPPKYPIKITASSGAQTAKKNGKDVYSLCKGDSIILSQERDITPSKDVWASPNFNGFKIAWFVGKVGSVEDAHPILNGKISDLVVSYNDASLAGLDDMIILYAVDADFSDSQCTCWTADTVYVRYEKMPTDSLSYPDPFCAGQASYIETLMPGYIVHWFEDSAGNVPLMDNISPSWFEELSSSAVLYYQLEDLKTRCKGDIEEFKVTVYSAPDSPETKEILMQTSGKKEVLEKSDDVPSGLVELWYESEASDIGTVTTPIIDLSKGGSYIFWRTYLNQNGCESEKSRVVVNVVSVPMPFVEDANVCVGESVDLKSLVEINTFVSDYGAYSLEYITSDGLALTNTVINTNIVNEGVTVLEYKVAQVSMITGFRSEYATIRIAVHNVRPPKGDLKVVYNASDAANGSFMPLLVQNPNAVFTDADAELRWYDERRMFIPDPVPPYIASQTDAYIYTYYVSSMDLLSGCESELSKVEVIVLPFGESLFSESVADAFAVYPNPAKNTIYIRYRDDAHVSIFDVNGRNVLNTKIQNGEVNIESLPSGTYYMTINNEVSARVVKE